MPNKIVLDDELLRRAVLESKSFAMVAQRVARNPRGMYKAVQRRIRELGLETSHFTSRPRPKVRWSEGDLRSPACELCGWAQASADGRVPVELDHINGDRNDNRIENLRILCPNCHSLQPTHRGLNQQRVKMRRACSAREGQARYQLSITNGAAKRCLQL